MICLCSYHADELKDGAQLEVIERHDLAVPRARDFARDSAPRW